MTDSKTYISNVIQSQNSTEVKIALIAELVKYTRDKFYDEGYKDGMADMKDEMFENSFADTKLF